MGSSVQARLDEETKQALDRIVRRYGWSVSRALRECILQTDKLSTPKRTQRMIGIGSVDFGPGDLATNKEYLRDLGVKSMGKGWRPPQERGE
jgi:predicted transcriptional regulator